MILNNIRGPPLLFVKYFFKILHIERNKNMMYGNNGNNGYPQGSTNNLWFGNNYSSGNSQASRSMMGNPMNPNGMMQGIQQPMQQPMQQMQPNSGQLNMNPQFPMPQSINNIIEVMGPESANNFAVGPNSHVMLTDTKRPVVYSKESDDSGYSETRAFLLTEIPLFEENNSTLQQNTQPMNVEYATKADLEETRRMVKSELNETKKFVEDLVMNHE